MTARTARRWAVAVFVICVAAAVGTLVLLIMGIGHSTPGDDIGVGQWGGVGFLVSSLAFGSIGALVVSRLPENRVGWVLSITGVAIAVGDVSYQLADQVLYGRAGQLPGGDVSALLQAVSLTPTFGLVGLAVLLFPTGRVPSARWRLAGLPAIVGVALLVTGYALRPGPLDPPFESVTNPIGFPGASDVMDTLTGIGYLLTGLGLVLAALAMRARFTRAQGLERQQLKWASLAAVVAGLFIPPYIASYFLSVEGINELRDIALGLALSAFPVAAGIAILRYRLYDIDVVINRTLVYGALTVTLAAVYLGSVLVLQLALSTFTEGSGLAVAASTLAVAALFRPARGRIQDVVDRRFFRTKYDAAQTLAAFSSHMRDQVDLKDIGADLIAVVGETVQPAHASLWLRTQETAR